MTKAFLADEHRLDAIRQIQETGKVDGAFTTRSFTKDLPVQWVRRHLQQSEGSDVYSHNSVDASQSSRVETSYGHYVYQNYDDLYDYDLDYDYSYIDLSCEGLDDSITPLGVISGIVIGRGSPPNLSMVFNGNSSSDLPSCPMVGYEHATTIPVGVPQPALSTLECEKRCMKYPGACQGWSWIDPLRAVNRKDLGICYLWYDYNTSFLSFADNGVWNGSPDCHAIDNEAVFEVYLNWTCPGAGYEYKGGDYITLRSSSVRGCQNHCREEPHCESWTWYEFPDKLCNLKNGNFTLVAVPVRNVHAGTRACLCNS